MDHCGNYFRSGSHSPALSVVAVVHRFDDKTGGDKAVLLNEWSNEEFGSEIEGEFDFS